MAEAARETLRDAPEDITQYTKEQIYAREVLLLREMPREVETEVQAFALRSELGDMAILGLPGEMFVEIGLRIKEGSPFRPTMIIELANDWVGYVPTKKAF